MHEGTVNVAILGCGRIARHMAQTLRSMSLDERYRDLIRPYAVATRADERRAVEFADEYGFDKAYGTYETMLADPEIDLVYIATPHALHAQHAIACMLAGKNVLVEKSFTANAGQARKVLDIARQTKLLCTEAIWTRYMPSRDIILDAIRSGVIGEPRQVYANLSYPVSGKARMTDPAMAGGALLDVGVYPINFVAMAFPEAGVSRVTSSCVFTDRGVDEQFCATFWLDNGVMAVVDASMTAVGSRQGIVQGDDGYLIVENINNPEEIKVFAPDHRLVDTLPVPEQITGYEYQVAIAAKAILDGDQECPEMPHEETLRIMGVMDDLRAQWGEVYPFEH
ncbi:gfo/Idh/MocA family oxidoreductase [Bifidobacterium sp. SMB2]|uniref:Gfo/Idh/MocA family oxidoreductase n=1 Tax=Bifidobacterium saimiriisciurei TaxID=2661627 RepID=A0ABX0CGR5_9BIFI|nr:MULTISPECIES: Gfo/Idh/MocA family oxidoreductase [Bifidobacterium]NEG96963.1 gfo/Idh/MocA family oxidoreductase [Bifidobacterium sp. SMB2]NEH11507.1 gfo/Idh/MocA family oxidoreductase [Bifidobacterium saimiriisciurei]